MDMSQDMDVRAVQDIAVISSILRVALETTGMGFAAVARVTEDRWLACEVLDLVDFGLKPGSEIPIKTTLCDEVRQHHSEIVIDHVAEDPVYADHHTPRLYGLQSYISVPIHLADGTFFGTLCAIDPKPAKIKDRAPHHMFRLFAELIGRHLDERGLTRKALADLAEERAIAELREQFMAVLGHDLLNPVAAVQSGTRMLLKEPQSDRGKFILRYMAQTGAAMESLVGNVLDLARCRLGSGIELDLDHDRALDETLDPVIEEALEAHPGRNIEISYDVAGDLKADHRRVAQLFSNLLSNALIHGDKDAPICVRAVVGGIEFSLAVESEGEPIAEGDRARLFQPFYRGDGSRTNGLGLGLFIASQIAQAHDGRIDLDCADGRTTFTFRMPLKPRKPALTVVD
jgi:signal transduction histidine kinase